MMGYGSEKSQSITISALENKGAERTGKVTFKMGNLAADLTVIQQSAIQPETLNIAQFNEKAPDTGDWYRITGTITQICDNSAKAYGNFYIKDDTGELFVYGLTKEFSQGSNDQSFSKLGLKEGDVLTFVTQRSEYHGEPQGGGRRLRPDPRHAGQPRLHTLPSAAGPS